MACLSDKYHTVVGIVKAATAVWLELCVRERVLLKIHI